MEIQTSPEFAAIIAALQPGQRRHGDRIPLDLIDDSPFNARTTYSEASIAELAETIEAHDVQEPILLRPVAGRFQLVFGHRRTRAARLTKLRDIPAMIEVMDDEQARVLQLIENIQREDLTPLEEAQGYRDLMKDHGLTAADLVTKTKRSRRWVFNKLKLLDLCQGVRDKLASGELSENLALAIARVYGEADQLDAMEEILEGDGYTDGPMSVRLAQEHVRDEYSVQLHRAIFSLQDASLVPDAGACASCPKRACAQPELFADDEEKDQNICLDRACFKAKREAHLQAEQALAKEEGRKTLSAKEGKRLMEHDAGEGRLVKLDERCYAAQRDLVTNEYPTYAQMLAGTDVKPTLINTDAGLVAAVAQNEAMAALAAKGIVPKSEAKRVIQTNKSYSERKATKAAGPSAEELQRKHEVVVQQVLRNELFSLIHTHPDTLLVDDDLARMIVLSFWNRMMGWGTADSICKAWGWVTPSGYADRNTAAEKIAELDRTRLTWLLVQMAIVFEVPQGGEQPTQDPPRMQLVAERMGINFGALKRQVVEQYPLQKPAEQAPAKSAKAAKPSSTPSTAARAAGKGAKTAQAGRSKDKATSATAAPAAAGAGDATDLFLAAQAGAAAAGAGEGQSDEAAVAAEGQGPAAQGDEDGAFWPGQVVKIKGRKGDGEVRELMDDGSILVATPSPSQDGVHNLTQYAASDLIAVTKKRPNQADDTAKPPAKKAATKPPVKYRHPVTGDTWTGLGQQPAWVKAALRNGRSLADLKVDDQENDTAQPPANQSSAGGAFKKASGKAVAK